MIRRSLSSAATTCYQSNKPKGYDFYNKVLGSPKYIVGPMVEQSELAWRILCRRYNAHLCYTPMFHARLFSDPIGGPKYRADQWSSSKEDRPLVVQFCANDPDILLKAAKMVEDECEAVDLNLGCPQHIAKKGRYGSFLQDDWELIHKLISTLDRELKVPVTAKIRVFESVSRTVDYAHMLADAGAQLLTVHGRLREQKGHHTGLANWAKIKAVKDAVTHIPIIANGNILHHDDLQACFEQTGVDGVMSAEGVLYNPTLFDPNHSALPPKAYDIALEYLDICKEIEPATRPSIVKGHLFKLFHTAFRLHTDLRSQLGTSYTLEAMERIALEMKDRLLRDEMESDSKTTNQLGPWFCQVSGVIMRCIHAQSIETERERERESER
ncbi:dihydrouridine synthase-domain-containing protein [Blakeslea trispora]|nr:dihydrouridine synthase-domain-containing protein [Blakeslea trispora]